MIMESNRRRLVGLQMQLPHQCPHPPAEKLLAISFLYILFRGVYPPTAMMQTSHSPSLPLRHLSLSLPFRFPPFRSLPSLPSRGSVGRATSGGFRRYYSRKKN